jgi:flagellar biosynthesis/type III secretory pathway M-ring protein FliF/YscJ
MDKESNSTGTEKKSNSSGLWGMLAVVVFIVIAAIIGSNANNPGQKKIIVEDPDNPNGVILMKPKKYEKEVQKARNQQLELKKQQRIQEDEKFRKETQKMMKENPGTYSRDTSFIRDGVEYQVVVEKNPLDIDLE